MADESAEVVLELNHRGQSFLRMQRSAGGKYMYICYTRDPRYFPLTKLDVIVKEKMLFVSRTGQAFEQSGIAMYLLTDTPMSTQVRAVAQFIFCRLSMRFCNKYPIDCCDESRLSACSYCGKSINQVDSLDY